MVVHSVNMIYHIVYMIYTISYRQYEFIDDLFVRGNLLFSMNISTGQCTKLLDAKLR